MRTIIEQALPLDTPDVEFRFDIMVMPSKDPQAALEDRIMVRCYVAIERTVNGVVTERMNEPGDWIPASGVDSKVIKEFCEAVYTMTAEQQKGF